MQPLLVPLLLCAVVSAPTPSFDVVPIKPNKSGSSMSVGVRGGRFNAVNATALTLAQNAYPRQTFHIFGAPVTEPVSRGSGKSMCRGPARRSDLTGLDSTARRVSLVRCSRPSGSSSG